MKPTDDLWACAFVPAPAPKVRLVSAAGGLVVAVGEAVHMLRPDSQRLRSRALPPGVEVLAVAAEPWSPYRLALATPRSVGVFSGHRPHEPLCDVTFKSSKIVATHLAWTRCDGHAALYVRQSNSEVAQVDLADASVSAVAGLAVAIAGDAYGALAMLDLAPDEGAKVGDVAIRAAGATEWTRRKVDHGPLADDTEWTVHLAVRGAAVAYSLSSTEPVKYIGGAQVSWGEGKKQGDTRVKRPRGIFRGPIAFQNEGAMVAAYNIQGQVDILRYARNGAFTRIARLGLDDDWEGTEATVTGLAWDEERRALWAASPELGLVKLTEPHSAEPWSPEPRTPASVDVDWN